MRRGLSIYSFDQNVLNDVMAHAMPLESSVMIQDLINDVPNLYIKKWEEDDLETEVLLSGSKIKDYRCTCSKYDEDGICGHVLAVLLAIQKEKKSKRYSTPPKSISTTGRINNIEQILDVISAEELAKFVKSYAANNRDFALSLRATFATKNIGNELDDTYKDLVSTILKHIHINGQRWTKRKADKLFKYTEQLIQHSHNFVATKDYAHAVFTVDTLCKKVLPICFRNEGFESLERLSVQIISIVLKLHTAEMSPALKEEIQGIIRYCIEANWYSPSAYEETLYFAIDPWNKQLYPELLNILISKLDQIAGEREKKAILLAAIIYYSDLQKEKTVLPNEPWSLLQWNLFLKVLTPEERILKCFTGVRTVYSELISDRIKGLAIQDLLQHLKTAKLQKPFLADIAASLLRSQNTDVINDVHKSNYPKVQEQLLSQSTDLEHFLFVSEFAKATGQKEDLLPYFDQATSIDATIGLLPILDSKRITERFPKILEDITYFLNNYFGQKNVDKIISFITILKYKGLSNELEQLLLVIKKDMPERTLLRSSLLDHFPELKKQL